MANIAFIQLSDIHFTGDPEKDHLFEKLPALISKICNHTWNASDAFVCLVGDIANSGLPIEYDTAGKFVEAVCKGITVASSNTRVHVLAVPGNHDCDHALHDTVRERLLKELSPQTIDEPVFAAISRPLTSFYDFVDKHCTSSFRPTIWKDKLMMVRDMSVGESSVRMCMLNSAWSCNKSSPYGSPRCFAVSEIPNESTVAITITVMHHPPGWISPIDGKQVRTQIAGKSQLFLTGHVHEHGRQLVVDTSGPEYQHIQGGCLQDLLDPAGSSFRVITLDTEAKEMSTTQYAWTGSTFEPQPEVNPLSESKLPRRAQASFSLAHDGFLEDVGASIRHPRVNEPNLSSLFVMPRLIRQDGTRGVASLVRAETLLDEICEQRHAIIFGAEGAGKSALAKRLTVLLAKRGQHPVHLQPGLHSLRSAADCPKLVGAAISAQFTSDAALRVADGDPNDRAVIIDDFHKISPKANLRAALLQYVRGWAGMVVLFAPETFLADEVMDHEDLSVEIARYSRFSISELSRRQRLGIIERWYRLGNESLSPDEEETLQHKIQYASLMIDKSLDRDYIPQFPVYVLALLHNIESSDASVGRTMSQGHLFQAMIYQKLASKESVTVDMDLRVSYLSYLAYCMDQARTKSASTEMAIVWHESFSREYLRNVSRETILGVLVDSGVLRQKAGAIEFAYPYLYCFFLASYLATDIHLEDTKARVRRLCEELHKDDAAQTLLSLCHLCKDPFVFRTVKERVKQILAGTSVFSFEREGVAIERLLGQFSKLVVAHDAKARQQLIERLLDVQDAAVSEQLFKDRKQDEEESGFLQDIHATYRAVQVVGQILKSNAGSLRANEKKEMATEAVALSLRVLNVLVQLCRDGIGDQIDRYSEVLKEEDEYIGTGELQERVHDRVAGVLRLYGVCVMKHLSASMGSASLYLVFQALLEDNAKESAYEVMIAGIELDHLQTFPMTRIEKLMKSDFARRTYGVSILRHMVWMHLVLIPVKYDIRQKVCSLLDIHIENKTALNPSTKQKNKIQSRSV